MLRRTGDWKRPEPPRWGVFTVGKHRAGGPVLTARRSTLDGSTASGPGGSADYLKNETEYPSQTLDQTPRPNGAPWELSIVETGATVPGYSGGLAACVVVSYLDFCSRGSLTPVAAPNVFLVSDRIWGSCFKYVF